jgi:VanZ family protein
MKKILFFVPAILYYALIFILSSLRVKGQVSLPFLDKGLHLVEFALLGFLLSFGFFLSFRSSVRVKSAFTLVIGILLGCLDEFHQYFVPERSFEVLDMVADSIGILIGLIAFYYLSRTHRGEVMTRRFEKIGE